MASISSEATAPPRGPAWKWWVCGLLLLATVINYMDRLTINQTAQRIKAELHLSNEQYGQIESAFGVAFALGAFGQANAPSSSSSFQDPSKIIQFLSSSVSWYRDRASEQKLATEPSDLGYIQENSRLADQVV